jgi:serine/threonine-protein kinase
MTLQDPLVGRMVDERYLIESRIANGGMATVYLALDRRLDRQVALKVMHEHLTADDEFVSRFVREARSAARLSHPNVVQVFDQGSDGSMLYLAMEYLPGRTLRDVLAERGALTPRESVSVLEAVLGALAAAHRAGIVHGDVKPENVILTDDGRIKVADFGLARAIATPISSSAAGQLVGTVAYLSPELVSRGVADARADVYAAGILLFELLTGKQPFTGDDPLQVAYRHVHEMVPAPSAISPQLPVAFDDVVLQATSHNPDLRPANADALLTDLHAALARVPRDQLDVRAVEAATLLMDANRTQAFRAPAVNGAPAAATQPQATRTLARPRRVGGQLVPRLRVDDDEPEAFGGFLGDRRRQRFAAIGAAIVVVLIIFTGVWWFTGGPGSYITTPALIGQRVSDAQSILKGQGLTGQVHPVFNPTVAAGQVISTNPDGGAPVRKQGTVVLDVSKGPQLIPVPAVAGKSVDDATTMIHNAQLQVGRITRKFSGTVDKGSVIRTVPVIGSTLAPGTTVDLVISKGNQPVLLDNVVNQNVDAATQLLQGKGLKVTVNKLDWFFGAPAPGTVFQQNPAAQGQTVDTGTTVTLTVINAPTGQAGTGQATTGTGQVNVPSVVGQHIDSATNELQGLGFKVTVQGNGNPFAQKVTGQSVTGQAAPGTEIFLQVGDG